MKRPLMTREWLEASIRSLPAPTEQATFPKESIEIAKAWARHVKQWRQKRSVQS